jgi:hypothetical protein
MKKTTLKTIEMTRRIRDAHYEQLKEKSHAERIAFYRAKARAFRKKADAVLQDQQNTAVPPTS